MTKKNERNSESIEIFHERQIPQLFWLDKHFFYSTYIELFFKNKY